LPQIQSSHPQDPSHLISRNRDGAPSVEVSQTLPSDSAVLLIDHRLVALDKFCRHDGGGALLSAAAGDVMISPPKAARVTTEANPLTALTDAVAYLLARWPAGEAVETRECSMSSWSFRRLILTAWP
jgi:hypothetical protein